MSRKVRQKPTTDKKVTWCSACQRWWGVWQDNYAAGSPWKVRRHFDPALGKQCGGSGWQVPDAVVMDREVPA